MGAPQPKEIVAARAADTLETVKNELEPEVLPYFMDVAESILAFYKNDAVMALSATIAMICNTTKKLPSRSLLTANEGFITLLFSVEYPIRNVGYIKSMTQKTFPALTYEDTIGWRLTADSQGVIVDVKEDKIKVNEDGSMEISGVTWKNSRGISISIPKELPELQERVTQQQPNGFGRGNGSRQGQQRGNGGGYNRGRSNGSSFGKKSYGRR